MCGVCRDPILGLNYDFSLDKEERKPETDTDISPAVIWKLLPDNVTFQDSLANVLHRDRLVAKWLVAMFPEKTVHLNRPLLLDYFDASDVTLSSDEMNLLYRLHATKSADALIAWREMRRLQKTAAKNLRSADMARLTRAREAAATARPAAQQRLAHALETITAVDPTVQDRLNSLRARVNAADQDTRTVLTVERAATFLARPFWACLSSWDVATIIRQVGVEGGRAFTSTPNVGVCVSKLPLPTRRLQLPPGLDCILRYSASNQSLMFMERDDMGRLEYLQVWPCPLAGSPRDTFITSAYPCISQLLGDEDGFASDGMEVDRTTHDRAGNVLTKLPSVFKEGEFKRDVGPASAQHMLICSMLKRKSGLVELTQHNTSLPSRERVMISPASHVAADQMLFETYKSLVPVLPVANKTQTKLQEEAVQYWADAMATMQHKVTLDVTDFDGTLSVKNMALASRKTKTHTWIKDVLFGNQERVELIRKWFDARAVAKDPLVIISFGYTDEICDALMTHGLLQYVSRVYARDNSPQIAIKVWENPERIMNNVPQLPMKFSVDTNAKVAFKKEQIVAMLHSYIRPDVTFFHDDDQKNIQAVRKLALLAVMVEPVGPVCKGMTVDQLRQLLSVQAPP
jgi:hypothetical protein